MKFYNGDCLEVLKAIPDGSIDLILADPPYGTTSCSWDSIIPLEPLWIELKRIRKPLSPVLLFGSEPFSSYQRMSNIKEFKYDWIWEKTAASNFALVKYQPLKEHEIISVFSKPAHKFYPIKENRRGSGSEKVRKPYLSNGTVSGVTGMAGNRKGKKYDELKFPSSIQYFNNREESRGFHPTQKPVALLEYLIKTYTQRGDMVLDFCMGSGSTGVACKRLYREFIGIEKDKKYYELAINRINDFKRGFGVDSELLVSADGRVKKIRKGFGANNEIL